MKTVSLFILIVWLGISFVQDVLNHTEQMEKLEQIQQAIEQRNHLDSLYWQHLENCSFIHKESIGIGYQGYLYYKESRK